jgi:hypothetical protein
MLEADEEAVVEDVGVDKGESSSIVITDFLMGAGAASLPFVDRREAASLATLESNSSCAILILRELLI